MIVLEKHYEPDPFEFVRDEKSGSHDLFAYGRLTNWYIDEGLLCAMNSRPQREI